jgi:transposase
VLQSAAGGQARFVAKSKGHKVFAKTQSLCPFGGFPMARSSTRRQKQNALQPVASAPVYAGLDYHKKFSMVCLGDADGNELATMRVPNDRHAFKVFFERYPVKECAIESCRGYEWLLDYLTHDLRLDVKLVNTLQAKLIIESRCKTDKLDSRAIMQLLAKRYLPTCYQPSAEERRLRERLRWRAHLVRYATRMKVRIHSLVDKENLAPEGKDLFSATGRCLLSKLPLSEPRRFLVDEHLQLLEVFEKMRDAEDRWVSQAVKADPRASLLLTVPGIGELTALLLVCELGDLSRFRDASAVCSYFGLVPGVSSSADRRHNLPLTKAGNQHVRWMLIQCAWSSIRSCMPLHAHFMTTSRRCGRNPAIVSVARKLLKICFRVLRDNKPFNAALVGQQRPA